MRVLVSVDMEGVAGVVAVDDIRPGHPEYERNRAYLTAEANAAVRGVLGVDPDAEVVVADAHAAFRNLLPHELDRRATLVRGDPRPYDMLGGLDDATDHVLFVGYHGRAGTARSVRAHTISGTSIAAVRLDGRDLGELGLNAALAAGHGAAPVLATGDDTLAAEAEAVVPGLVTVVVKQAHGNSAAGGLHPAAACDRIEAAVPAALAAAGAVRPPRFAGRIDLEVDLLRPVQTERLLLVPGVERRGARTVGYLAPGVRAVHDVLSLVATLAAAV